jgi:hypothetical protein
MSKQELTKKAVASLVMIGGVTDRLRRDTDLQRQYVDLAREEGASWRMIGNALGVTAQAAWQRFSGLERDSEIQDQVRLPFSCDET